MYIGREIHGEVLGEIAACGVKMAVLQQHDIVDGSEVDTAAIGAKSGKEKTE
jgi:hypothetical protein